ncbi:hypothetical protein H2203_001139 [Taxawa tesnikishii (nom. ined.)]|nr:hypothetical protein H2203_001139 [Dothideales sp. JES 119]
MKSEPCDPARPGCKLYLFDRWRCNTAPGDSYGPLPLAQPQPLGSWRERQGLHWFITYTAPQLSGAFFGGFFQRTIIPLSQQEALIFHALVALGASHASLVESASREWIQENFELSLEECNKAIVELRKRSASRLYPRLTLVLCLLLTEFEIMQDRLVDAAAHAIQARDLMQYACAECAVRTSNDSKVPLTALAPMVRRLELFGGVSKANKDLYMPTDPLDAACFWSLEEAASTLEPTYSSMRLLMEHVDRAPGNAEVDSTFRLQRDYIVSKLVLWEHRFSALLTQKLAVLSEEEKAVAMTLKACHLHAFTMARAPIVDGTVDYSRFVSDFEDILSLSYTVIKQHKLGSRLPTSPSFIFLLIGMCRYESLYFVIARCTEATIRWRAASLFLTTMRMALNNSRPTNPTDPAQVAGCIVFAIKTPVCAGMALFAAGGIDNLSRGTSQRPVFRSSQDLHSPVPGS